ncbi:hypothetical protein TRIUR3_14700 [Triticum urartu]|uniref:Uncharacterized protein n=1 Tax=Triticum urartu TaxID=4572 RepID=M7ZAP5_TRIUA|nr:hypothetical protein TRIUR3_14700 [Triticum urartu]
MAFTRRNTGAVCLAALMVVMATMMLSCDADFCFDIPGPCVQSLCKDECARQNYPNRPHCQPVTDECCCDTSARPEVDHAIRQA